MEENKIYMGKIVEEKKAQKELYQNTNNSGSPWVWDYW